MEGFVNRTMGQEGPRTEEKWRRRGARLLRGRSSIMAATFESTVCWVLGDVNMLWFWDVQVLIEPENICRIDAIKSKTKMTFARRMS